MNDRLLLRKRVNISNDYSYFLCFIHPHYDIVINDGVHISDLDDYDNPNPAGIIYASQYSDDTIKRLDAITHNWIIVNQHTYDIDISTNEGLIKNLLPIHYSHIKNSNDKELVNVYNNMSYDTLLNKIKICLISNIPLEIDELQDLNTLKLYESLLLSQSVLDYEYFNTVNKSNVGKITSSILTFLNKVQLNNNKSSSVYYSRLINQSNHKYGKKIKSAISKFVKSPVSNKELSLYNLLTSINKAN
jgi:hypothetical protein